jgi:hypothetical protein
MSALRELQARFRDAVLGGAVTPVLRTIAADGLEPAARLAIYGHHVSATLTDALRATFPVVARLVDDRFFAYAADRFSAALPPTSPCLSEYGDAFPDFLASFEPCRALVYLPDVARLEWALSRAQDADDGVPLDPRTLAEVPVAERAGLRLAFHASITLLASPWPIDRIWRANQPRDDEDPGGDRDTMIDLDAGGVRLEIRRRADAVVFRALAPGVYRLRRELFAGRTLGDAATAALAEDAELDLAAVLSELFHDDTLVQGPWAQGG